MVAADAGVNLAEPDVKETPYPDPAASASSHFLVKRVRLSHLVPPRYNRKSGAPCWISEAAAVPLMSAIIPVTIAALAASP